MFGPLRTEVVDRIFQVRQFASEACNLGSNPSSAVASKGLVFVQLYAVYEFVVTGIVTAALTEMQSHRLQIRDARLPLLGIVLEAELASVATVGPANKWPRRLELFERTHSTDPVAIPTKHFPGDGSHFRRPQLDTIWMLFGLTSPVVPHGRHFDLIEELVEHRNAIAHGREKPEKIGGRFSDLDISARIDWTRDLCLHLITEMETHCADPANLRR
jgi:hypothetical protein